MCRETQGADEAPREKVFGEAAASPEKRRAPRTANPLAELAEKERARAEAKAKSTAEGAGGKTAAATTVVKKRRKDLANEKAGNHLALVSWIGEGKKDGVRRDRTFYEGFRREGVEFRNGDCVYCLPERTTENMYLAQIQRCFEDDDKSMMIECCWFMTQDEVRAWGGDLPPSTEPEEIFLGTSVDVNPIAALEGLAPVMTHDAFTASAPRPRPRPRARPPTTSSVVSSLASVTSPCAVTTPRARIPPSANPARSTRSITCRVAVSSFSGRLPRRRSASVSRIGV